MPLKSKLMAGDKRLEACLVQDQAHVTPGSHGYYVGMIQDALVSTDAAVIDKAEIATWKYGPTTTIAVRNFKTKRHLLNYAGKIDDVVGKKTIENLDRELAALPERVFIIHDVRLFGWKPAGDVLEVNGDTPLNWVLDNIASRGKACGGNLTVKIMAHGLPGFVQFARGARLHPTLSEEVRDPQKGNLYIGPGRGGICEDDLDDFASIRPYMSRIEFHSCLVARIGPCHEANGHVCYDGNSFCYQLAQRTMAQVVASPHLQWYWPGGGPGGTQQMHFGDWNGMLFTWGPGGNIIKTETYPYDEKGKVPPPKDTVQSINPF